MRKIIPEVVLEPLGDSLMNTPEMCSWDQDVLRVGSLAGSSFSAPPQSYL